MNENFEQNVYSNRYETDKVISISENPTKIKLSFVFFRDTEIQGLLVHTCFRKEIGARLLEQVR